LVFLIGLALVAPYRTGLRSLFRAALSLVPSGLLLVHWALFTKGGDFVRSAMTTAAQNTDVWPFNMSFNEIYRIAFDTYRDGADEKVFAASIVIGAVMTVLAVTQRRHKETPGIVSTARWLLIPLVCAILYFRAEGQNGYLGHIRDRFSVFAFLCLVPALRMPKGVVSHVGAAAMFVVAAYTAETFNWHLARFEQVDVGDFDQVVEAIPPNKRVASLIFRSESDYFGQNPFLHYGMYYLVEKGGVVNFSFSGYPHWVSNYRPHQDLLGASPPIYLWEWRPDRNRVREELTAAYDYVVARGPGFDPPDDLWVCVLRTTRWSVWQRRAA
jgi:hypothetical protein